METTVSNLRLRYRATSFIAGLACLGGLAGAVGIALSAGLPLPGTAAGAAAQGPCQALLLNFAGLPAGTILGEQFAASGVHISATGFPGSEDAVIVFDSNSRGTRETDDIEVDIGNLAIIPKNLTDRHPKDGLVDVPEDSAAGGVQKYTFDHERIVNSFVFVDKDRREPGTATAFDAPVGGSVIKSATIPNGPNGNVQTIVLNASGVRRLEISYNDSGALTALNLGCVGVGLGAPGQPAGPPSITQVTTPTAPPTGAGGAPSGGPGGGAGGGGGGAGAVPTPGPTAVAPAVSLPSGGSAPGGESTLVSLTLLIAAAGLAVCGFVVAMAYRRKSRVPVAPLLMRRTHSDWQPINGYASGVGLRTPWD